MHQERRRTTAQALVEFLRQQHVERDGREVPFFAGCFGIFGHGNVAGLGEALLATPDFPYHQTRNEQAMVHTAAAFAKMSNRLRTYACTTSIGPGATNMVTAAAGATINRLPVLLLPGDVFARRNVAPVLQQLEAGWSQDVSVNDAFRPVSRYWDRIQRPEQLVGALPEAMRVLTSPADTGAVTLALPQDVQAEAWEFPDALFRKRVWHVPRPRADRELLRRAAEWIRDSASPLIVAGGGVIYSEATDALVLLAEQTGIPVAETQAGKGALPFDHPCSLGALGVTGTPGANRVAAQADLVLGVGTRYSDFTTASKTAFADSGVRFVNVNVAELDAHKHAALPLVADARVTLEALAEALEGGRVRGGHEEDVARYRAEWDEEVERLFHLDHGPPISQGEVIGVVDEVAGPRDVVVCAAGSLPGDLHKLWRPRDPKGYHLEYGYSCMGYEVAGGLGVRLAAPDREVFVLVGDGSWLMLSQEVVTAVQEGVKLNVVLLDNHGYSSIGGLSESVGCGGFGTEYRYRGEDGQLSGDVLPVDLVANARSLGARAVRATTRDELRAELARARSDPGTTVVVVEVDREQRVPAYETWWDVPVAEESELDAVRRARALYEDARRRERYHL